MSWLTKALSTMRHSPAPGPLLGGLLRRTRYDYRREVGDGLDTSVITAPVQWIQRALPEARLTVQRRGKGGKVDEVEGHGALALIARPNPFYGDIALWSGTLLSYLIAGNAYWLKVRNGVGRPAELWYVPHWTMQPAWDSAGREYLTHYLYTPGGGGAPMQLEARDVVHFRHGMDPRNLRLGLSPLDGVIREVFMDLEASNFVASLLRNMGVPGVVISPEGGAMPAPEDVEATKAWFQEAFGGDRRGGPLVMGAPTKVQPYGFNPQQMNMSEARDVAEERVCACLGIPAAIVGFGAGLQQTKVGATMAEMRKLAWQNGVLPVARALADELDRALLPDFGDASGLRMLWDTDDVVALQDDLDKEASRWNTMIRGGWAMISEGREAMGLEVDASHRIYLRSGALIETPEGAAPRPIAPPAAAAPGAPLQAARKHGAKARRDPARMRAAQGFLRALQRQQAPLESAMQSGLEAYFKGLGAAAAAAAGPLLKADVTIAKAPAKPGRRRIGTKADELLILQILEAMGIDAREGIFVQLYRDHYIAVGQGVAEAGSLVGLGGSLPDPVARAIVAAGGRRAGLVDLSDQSHAALFEALAEGRAAGEGVSALSARIADQVEAGPWKDAATRATIIARTETKYAQNISTIERARAAGVENFIVFDGRLGPGRSLPSHIARHGSVVNAFEAAEMAAAEHPNGTLSFAPSFDDDDDEEEEE